MILKSSPRNELGKCDEPSNTIRRISEGFARLGIDDISFRTMEEGVWAQKGLYWGWCETYKLRTRATGKGTSPELCSASGHAELAERFSAYFYRAHVDHVHVGYLMDNADIIRQHFRYSFLSGYVKAHQDELENAVRIEDILQTIGSLTPAELEAIKAAENNRHWVDAYSLLTGRTVKVPLMLVRYTCGTNGIAAGNTLEEAIVQAACEVFERYAMRQVIDRVTVPTIELDSVPEPTIRRRVESFARENFHVIIKDFSQGGLLPVVGILTINGNVLPTSVEHRIVQLGSSFNRQEALMRCFTERSQGRVNYQPLQKYAKATCIPAAQVSDYYCLLTDRVTDADISYLEQGESVAWPTTPTFTDCLEEIVEIKRICGQLGTDCLIVDHTHPVLQFPVVRVIIPGISDVMPYYPPMLKTREKLSTLIENSCEYERTVVRLMQSFYV